MGQGEEGCFLSQMQHKNTCVLMVMVLPGWNRSKMYFCQCTSLFWIFNLLVQTFTKKEFLNCSEILLLLHFHRLNMSWVNSPPFMYIFFLIRVPYDECFYTLSCISCENGPLTLIRMVKDDNDLFLFEANAPKCLKNNKFLQNIYSDLRISSFEIRKLRFYKWFQCS